MVILNNIVIIISECMEIIIRNCEERVDRILDFALSYDIIIANICFRKIEKYSSSSCVVY